MAPSRAYVMVSRGGCAGTVLSTYAAIAVVRTTATASTGPSLAQLQTSAAMEMAFNAAG